MEVAAALVSAQCEAARSLEIAKARANAALYALLGVLLPGAIAAGPISTTTACQQCFKPVAAAFQVMAGTKYADRIIDGVSAKGKAKKRLQKAIGTAGVHVTAEFDAVDTFHRSHGVAV